MTRTFGYHKDIPIKNSVKMSLALIDNDTKLVCNQYIGGRDSNE